MPDRRKSTIGRLGAYSAHAKNDTQELTKPARAAFLKRFERKVDPENRLDPEERARRAQAALRAHMTRLALRSAASRSRRTDRGMPRTTSAEAPPTSSGEGSF